MTSKQNIISLDNQNFLPENYFNKIINEIPGDIKYISEKSEVFSPLMTSKKYQTYNKDLSKNVSSNKKKYRVRSILFLYKVVKDDQGVKFKITHVVMVLPKMSYKLSSLIKNFDISEKNFFEMLNKTSKNDLKLILNNSSPSNLYKTFKFWRDKKIEDEETIVGKEHFYFEFRDYLIQFFSNSMFYGNLSLRVEEILTFPGGSSYGINIYNQPNSWPKNIIEPPYSTAFRELYEETGYKTENIDDFFLIKSKESLQYNQELWSQLFNKSDKFYKNRKNNIRPLFNDLIHFFIKNKDTPYFSLIFVALTGIDNIIKTLEINDINMMSTIYEEKEQVFVKEYKNQEIGEYVIIPVKKISENEIFSNIEGWKELMKEFNNIFPEKIFNFNDYELVSAKKERGNFFSVDN